MNNNSLERTLSIIKPDAVERELETKIKKIFVDNKLNIVDSKKIQISKVCQFRLNLFQLKDQNLEMQM